MKHQRAKHLHRISLGAAALALTLSITPSLDAGLHVWRGSSQFGPYFSDPDNWKSGGVPTANESNVTLEFPFGAASNQPIIDIPNLKVDKIDFQNGYTLYGLPQGSKLTLRGTADAIVTSQSSSFHNSVELILEGSSVEMDVAATRSLVINGKISGAGGIAKTGLGTLDLGGSLSNTYTGDTEVKTGTMRLMKATGTAVAGDIIVGDGIGAVDTDQLKLSNDNQIANSASLTVNASGYVQLVGNDEAIAGLTLKGGHVSTGAGVLAISGSIASLGYLHPSKIEGTLDFGARGKSITVENGFVDDDLIINAVIKGGANVGLGKNGPGTLVLGGANTFPGVVNINAGILKATHPQALGSTTAGTTVFEGGTLWLGAVSILNESLTLNGKGPGNLGTLAIKDDSAVWDGPITLSTDVVIEVDSGLLFQCPDVVQGPGGILKLGEGELSFGGPNANTYGGTTSVQEGTLSLSKSPNVTSLPGALIVGHGGESAFPRDRVLVKAPNQIANTAPITVNKTGWFQLLSSSESVASLNITGGEVVVTSSTLTLLGPVQCSAPKTAIGFITGVNGILSLGVQSRQFTVDPDSHLRVTLPIVGANLTGVLKQGEGLLEFTGENTYSGLTSIEEGRLLVTGPDGTLGSSTVGTLVSKGAQLITSWVQIGAEPLVLSGDGLGTDRASFSAHGDCTWAGPITLSGGTNTIEVQTVRLIVSGAISGSGPLRALGHTVNGQATKLWISGLNANTYNGVTTVETCELWMSKLPGLNAIPGALFLMDKASVADDNSRAYWVLGHQIADSAPVHLGLGAELNLGNMDESFASLELHGAKSLSTNGVLTLLGDVTVLAGKQSTLAGKLNLGTDTRTFEIQGNTGGITELNLTAQISGGSLSAGIRKTGTGDLAIWGQNSYTGPTQIEQGLCLIYNNSALGTAFGDTMVQPGGSLYLSSGLNIVLEKLVLNGFGAGGIYNGALVISGSDTNSWSGPVVLASDTSVLLYGTPDRVLLSGQVSGQGSLSKRGPGTLEFTGNAPNTYTGKTDVEEGTLALNKTGAIALAGALQIGDGIGGLNADVVRLMKADQIANLSAVSLAKSGLLDLANFSETIGSLAGEGNVSTLFSALTTGGDNTSTTFGGTLSGVGFTTLIKNGTGAMTLTGDSLYTGKTLVQAGTLWVQGQLAASPVWVTGGSTLGGQGIVGPVSATNGIVSPGSSPGRLTSGNVAMNSGSTFRVELNGALPGKGYDQLSVKGTVALGGAQLLATLGYASASGTVFVIIENDSNDAVQQTFAGLPEGATFNLGGVKFEISYKGGDGNDVVLRHVNTPPSFISVSTPPLVEEGGQAKFEALFADVDPSDTLKLVINWGDGSPAESFNIPPGSFGLTVFHSYPDDNPTSTSSDAYVIDYALHDTTGIGGFGNKVITVKNVAPLVNAGPDSSANVDALWTAQASFSDPGTDAWTATVDYGDGSGVQALVIGAGKTLPLSHTYTNAGTFTVLLTVQDDDGGSSVDSLLVTVQGSASGPQLTIKPGPGNRVTISWPASATGYSLEKSGEVTGGVWVSANAQDSEINGEFVVILPSLEARCFFRLRN